MMILLYLFAIFRRIADITYGPAIRASLPAEGESSIDENQVFILALDTEIEPSSLAIHVHCEIDGIAEQIGVEFLSGEAREYELCAFLLASGH